MKIIWWFWKRKIHKKFLEYYIFFASLEMCSTIKLYFNVKTMLFNRAFRLELDFKIRALLYNKILMLKSSTYFRALFYNRAFALELNTYLHVRLVTHTSWIDLSSNKHDQLTWDKKDNSKHWNNWACVNSSKKKRQQS